jgi:hypothetical protein
VRRFIRKNVSRGSSVHDAYSEGRHAESEGALPHETTPPPSDLDTGPYAFT